MICPHCAHENIDGLDQCAECGADLTGVDEGDRGQDIERDLLTRPLGALVAHDYAEVSPDTTVRAAVERLSKGGGYCAVVVDEGKITGIFTERDILQRLADGFDDRADHPVSQYMTPHPETLREQDPVAFGLNRMMVGGYRHIPIENNGTLVGVVSVRDILHYLAEQFGDVLDGVPAA